MRYKLLTTGVLACILAGRFGAWVHAQESNGLPDMVTYRGYLEGPEGALPGEHEIVFTLYDTATAAPKTGARLWGPLQQEVSCSDDHFAAQLSGLATALVGNSGTWLEVGVVSPGGAVQTLARHATTSVPYAFRSGRAASAASADMAAWATSAASADAARATTEK